jgi:hypothetical protein
MGPILLRKGMDMQLFWSRPWWRARRGHTILLSFTLVAAALTGPIQTSTASTRETPIYSDPATTALVGNPGNESGTLELQASLTAATDAATSVMATTSPPTLLAAHTFHGPGIKPEWLSYRPRQFKAGLPVPDATWGNQVVNDPGPYANWDYFATPNTGPSRISTQADWLELQMTRSATLAVVWRHAGTIPRWLQTWTRGTDIVVNGIPRATYRKSVAAGKVLLGGVHDTTDPNWQKDPRTTYWVLFGEANATASPAPSVPSGQTVPKANDTCPAWVHDSYKVNGPDGKSYPTWHPQIDPVYWCYFRHEHGSDPSLLSPSIKPAYGYVSAVGGVSESHPGFKSYVFDDSQGNRWLLTHHFGTGSLARVCTRFHAIDVVAVRKSTSELLADLHILGDFGKAVVNSTDQPLTPSACRDQAAQADASGSRGIRKIPVVSAGAVGYEPWRVDGAGNVIGFNTSSLTFNTPDAVVICMDVNCNVASPSANFGTKRFFSYLSGFGVVAGPNSGTFYTDPRGKTVMTAGQAGAVRQFIKAGVNISLPAVPTNYKCLATENWRVMYACVLNGSLDAMPVSLEGSLRPPN